MSKRLSPFVILILVIVASGRLFAQTTERSGIEGKITDETGGLLPGVTVTISSPALLMPQVVAVTDSEGRYRFTALPAGIYSATYELEGFQTIKREGLRLNAGFVATVDIKMSVGGVKEEVVVTGGSPVVDVRTTAVSTNFSTEALETIPTSRSMWQVIGLSPGMRVTATTPDVGGNTVGTQQGYQNYGSGAGGNRPTVDGVDTRESSTAAGFYYDFGAFEEVQIKAMGNDAEVAVPGTNFVAIVKSGGNTFHGNFLAQWETPSLQSDNIDNELRAQGVTAGNPLKQYFDFNADLGGRVIRDRLWFYGSVRRQRIRTGLIGYSRAPGPDGIYGTADDIPGEYRVDLTNYTGKVTGQINSKNKVVAFYQYNKKDYPEREGSAYVPAEASCHNLFVPYAAKGEWTSVPTNRSLLNVFVARAYFKADYLPYTDRPSAYDTVTLRWTGASVVCLDTTDPEPSGSDQSRWQYNASYTYYKPDFLGGDHDLKIGGEFTKEYYNKGDKARGNGNDFLLQTQNGAAFQVILYNIPFSSRNNMDMQSLYVKDNWRIGDRLTLNLGLRAERYNTYLPAQSKPAGTFSVAGDFPKTELLAWKGLAPRLAFSYALSADARTVVKASYGRFNYVLVPQDIRKYNRDDIIASTYRWQDLNRNGTFDPDTGELGAFVSATGASTTVLNPDLTQPRVHEITATFERELMKDFSGRVSYILKRQDQLFQAVNPLRPYSAYTIPITTRDPGPDGKVGTADDGELVTYYDYDPTYAGRAHEQSLDTNTPGYQNQYHNFELVAQKRLSNRWQLLASYLATKRNLWRNGIPQDPNAESFFPKDNSWEWLLRVSGSYLFPYDIQVAASFSNQSGIAYARDVRFTTGLKQLTNLILLMEPIGAQRRPNQNLLNIRLEKVQRLKFGEFSFQFDLFNALNTNAATNISGRSGPTYGRITAIIPPRIARLGVTYSF